MEQNLPIITKKLCNMVKLAFFMLKKGVSKKKILLDLNLMMMKRRRKTAFASSVTTTQGRVDFRSDTTQAEYEFSCSNTPLYHQYFNNNKKNNQVNYYYNMPSPKFENIDNFEAVNKVLETMLSNKDSNVQQLKITDNEEEYGDQHVDEAAEEFIKRFYSQLKEQNTASN